MLEITLCPYDSPEYLEALALRVRVLRQPLGLRYTNAELERDRSAVHCIAKRDGVVVGTGQGFHERHAARLRQIAVEPTQHRQGIGRAIMEKLESHFADLGSKFVLLHARIDSVPFYEAMGYHKIGEPFEEVGIKHYRMEKSL